MENLQGGTLALEHRYSVEQCRGRNGLVTVYSGRQEPFDRPIWISAFDPLLESDRPQRLFDRLKASAHLCSELAGPGILRVVDYGELEHGVPFVISERANPGPSESVDDATPALADHLEREGTLAPMDMAGLVSRLASVLEQAHDHQLPHGGLTPRWIFLPHADVTQAMVGHFGLGLSFAELDGLPDEAGRSIDALWALPPEAFEPKSGAAPFTAAADVYALGAIAYTALVGVHPFFDDPSDTSEGLLRIKADEAPLLCDLGIDVKISLVVEAALQRDPEARPSPKAFARALEEVCCPPRERVPATQATPEQAESVVEVTLTTANDRSPVSERLAPASNDAAHPVHANSEYPAPSGNLLTLAIALALITNLAWFFVVVHQRGDAPLEEPTLDVSTALTTQILPSGLQLKTAPAGAELFLVEDDGHSLLGTTPHVLGPHLRDHDQVKLKLTKPGFRDYRLEMHKNHAGHDVLLFLTEDEQE